MLDISANNEEVCEEQKIFLKHVRDLLKPIEFTMTYKLVVPDGVQYNNINTNPIIDTLQPAAPVVSVDFERECDTPSCETDLAVSAMFTDKKNVIPVDMPDSTGNEFVFDSNKVSKLDLTITLNVDSTKDRAYESQVNVSLGPLLSYTGADELNDESIDCSGNTESANTVICSFGRAILQGEKRKVILSFEFEQLGADFTTINVSATTTSRDTLLANNKATLKVKVNTVTDLELLGSVTRGDNVVYGGGEIKGASAMKRDDDIGDLVQHTYTVINSGDHGTVSKVTLIVQWPYEIAASGEYLLYMITYPKRVDSARECSVRDEYINKLGLEIVDEEIPLDEESRLKLRRKRQTKQTGAVKTQKTTDGSSRKVADLNCYDGTATCFNVTCEFINMKPQEIIKVRFTSRLWNSSLTKDFHNRVDVVKITSTGNLYIDPAAKVSQTNTRNDGTNVTTEAVPDIALTPVKPPVQIWILIVAGIVGLVLLIVIILVCWKCGFFRRNRPPTYAMKVEKQREGTKYNQVPQSEPEKHLT